MTDLAIFDFGGRKVRTAGTHEAPLFCAEDACAILGYADIHQAINRLDQDEVVLIAAENGSNRVGHGNSGKHAAFVTESGLYVLILGCRKPQGKAFKKWVTSEVLPAIRKTGSYGQPDPIAVLNDPTALRGLLHDYAGRVLELQAANAELAPKAEVYDRIVDNTGTLGFREAAKVVHAATGVSEPEFRVFLLSRGWVQRLGGRLAPAHYGQAQGYVTTREREVATQDGLSLVVPELRITQRGITRATAALLKESA